MNISSKKILKKLLSLLLAIIVFAFLLLFIVHSTEHSDYSCDVCVVLQKTQNSLKSLGQISSFVFSFLIGLLLLQSKPTVIERKKENTLVALKVKLSN